MFEWKIEKMTDRDLLKSNHQKSIPPVGMRQLKDEFFSLAAHEIRTPITVIKAQAQLAERFHAQGKLQGVLIDKTLRVFVQQSDRLARLCSDLLDIARLDSDCFEVHLSTVDLGDLIEDVLLRQRPRDSAHELSFEKPATPLFVLADPERTRQIFANILSNATRYSPEGGAIVIAVSAVDGVVTVSVRDQGLGIHADRLGSLFERYYQAHQTGLKGPCGLGLGLYLCREALRRMGGEITAKSDGLGFGSVFTFTLPLTENAAGDLK